VGSLGEEKFSERSRKERVEDGKEGEEMMRN